MLRGYQSHARIHEFLLRIETSSVVRRPTRASSLTPLSAISAAFTCAVVASICALLASNCPQLCTTVARA